MVNYILLYKIRRIVKKILKDKIADDEIATTPKSCIGCLADDISWEVYYLLKEREDKDAPLPPGKLRRFFLVSVSPGFFRSDRP
jgi:hypothetical protein